MAVGGKANWGRTAGTTSAENIQLGTQLDQNITPDWFGFGKADYLRDKPANVATRASLFGGVGRHVVKTDALTFDLSVGLGTAAQKRCWPKNRRTNGRRPRASPRSCRSTPR